MAFNKLSLKERLLSKAVRSGDCLIWQSKTHPRGWGIIRNKGKWVKAYRASYEAHKGPIPKGMVVMHSCDNPACINPDHLSLGTQADNVHDMLKKGRANKASGERHPKAKLTAVQAAEIRRRYRPRDRNDGARPMAREFGISHAALLSIIRGETWK